MSSDNVDRLMRDLERILRNLPPNYFTDEAGEVWHRTYSRPYSSFLEIEEVNWKRDGF
jgi:hypothetical protein